MLKATGRIVVVQEGRFLLEDDSRGHRLLIASHALRLNPEDLRALARGRRHITVRYRKPEHLVAGIAEGIDLADATTSEASHGLRRSLAEVMRGFLRDWSLPHQLFGQSDRSDAAKSIESSQLAARLLVARPPGQCRSQPNCGPKALPKSLRSWRRSWASTISTGSSFQLREIETRAVVTG